MIVATMHHQYHNKHAAMQQQSRLSPVPAPDYVYHPPDERRSSVAANVREASGRVGKARESLATAAGLDIRTINRIYTARPVRAASLRVVAGTLGVSVQEIRLPPEDFVALLDRRDAATASAELSRRLAATLTPPVSRPPLWRRALRAITRALTR